MADVQAGVNIDYREPGKGWKAWLQASAAHLVKTKKVMLGFLDHRPGLCGMV